MSKADADRLINDLHSNDALRFKIHGAAEEIVRVATEAGYEVSRQEISAALRDHWKTTSEPDCKAKFSEAPGF